MNFKDLIVWQKSMSLVTLVYNLTKEFPVNEQYGLTSQIRRCAVSIPSNIAEGYWRLSKKSFVNFLKISMGSLAELETQVLLSRDLKYIDETRLVDVNNLILEVQKMLSTMIKNHTQKN